MLLYCLLLVPKCSTEKPFNHRAHKSGVVDFCFHEELKRLILASNFPATFPAMLSLTKLQERSM